MSQREGRSPGRGQPDVRHPEPHLSAGCCQAWHPWALITEEAAFPFLLGKESGPSKVAKDLGSGLQRQKDRGRGQEGTLWRCQQTSEVGARHGLRLTQLSSAPAPTPGMPVDVNSAAFRLWPILNGSSFHGCIRNLYINNELQDFTKTRMKPGVVPGCEPCRKLYCLHGICQPNATPGPVCHCEAGWGGLHCDQPADGPCHGHK